ncbi:tetratricopeptide repeat protein [Colwelliaceae bacterium 6441]
MNKIFTSFALAASLVLVQLPTAFEAQSADAPKAEKQKRKVYLPGQSVGKKVAKAFEAYSADDIEGALVILNDIDASKDFDKVFVSFFTGQMYAQKGDALKAIEKLDAAIKPDMLSEADQGNGLKLLADLQMQEKQFKSAITNYNTWMDFTGKSDGNVWVKVAQAYAMLEQFDKVIAPADKAIAAYGDKHNQNPYLIKLNAYYERKMFKQCVSVLETAVQVFPETKQFWTQLASFYAMVENYPKSLSTLQLAYKQGYLEKESEIKMLANLYAQSQLPHKSATLLEKHISSGLVKRDDKNLFSLANAWHAAMHIDKAAKYYGELAKMTNEAKHYSKQGSLLAQDEQFKKAVVALNKAIDLGVENKGRLYMSIAESHFYLGQYKQAYAAIQQAMKDPKTRKGAKGWVGYIKDTAARKGKSI